MIPLMAKVFMNIQENIMLSPKTVFKIGGPARYFCEVTNSEDLSQAITWAHDHHVKFFILGAGSNVLVSDDGFAGLAIKMNMRGIEIVGSTLVAGAGVSMALATNHALQNNLSGFEWAIGIPGTIGGSVFGNAGCFGSEMKDVVQTVEVFDADSGRQFPLHVADCNFRYRHSIFKENSSWIILGATLRLSPGKSEESRAKVLEYTKKRAASQDIGAQCAGCIFKNISPYVSAGKLIDSTGLKNLTVGGATVSPKHANYIVNNGKATAHDVRALIKLIKEKVKEKQDVELEEEIRYI